MKGWPRGYQLVREPSASVRRWMVVTLVQLAKPVLILQKAIDLGTSQPSCHWKQNSRNLPAVFPTSRRSVRAGCLTLSCRCRAFPHSAGAECGFFWSCRSCRCSGCHAGLSDRGPQALCAQRLSGLGRVPFRRCSPPPGRCRSPRSRLRPTRSVIFQALRRLYVAAATS